MSVLLSGKTGTTQKPIIYGALQISSSLRDIPVPVFWGQRSLSTNCIWYNDFAKHPQSAKGGGKGGGKGGQYDYTAAVILALSRGTIDDIVNVWSQATTTNTTTLSKLNMTLFDGSPSQSPPSFVTTKYPLEARNYNNTGYLFCPKCDLGSSATIPNNTFECVRANGFPTRISDGYINPTTHAVTPAIDVLMADVIPDYLTNPVYGMGFSMGDFGSLTQYRNYTQAQGLYFSPCLKQQEQVTTTIDRWAILTNSWIFWSGTQLLFIPLGDSGLTGNGATYVPDNTIAYDFGVNDFLDKDAPVKPTIMDESDVMNRTALTITDRTMGYTSNPLEWKDDTLVNKYGLRDNASTQGDEICDPNVGAIVVQLIGKRGAYIQRTYTWKASYRFILALPGCLVTLTDPNLKLDHFPVRIRTIEEDDDGTLTFTAEEFPGTIGTYTSNTNNAPQPVTTFPSQTIDPGDVNTPAVVEPNSSFTDGQALLIVAASGGTNWGGADVWAAFQSGGNYSKIGTISAPAIQGTLTADLPLHVDPDTVDTLSVDCTESGSEPTTVTTDDADALRTLSLVVAQPTFVGSDLVVPNDGELLAFGDVTATGTFTADLTYLRRGQYGTAPADHPSGQQFTLLDVSGNSGTSIQYRLPVQYIGSTIYLKFVSFNVFGGANQDISTVAEYSYTPTGAGYGSGAGGVPADPTGLNVSPGAGANNVGWSPNAGTDNVTSYKLYRAAGLAQPFAGSTLIWQGLATSYVDTVGSGSPYTYWLEAVNVVGPSNPVDTDLTSNTVTYPFRAMGGTPGRKPANSEELFNALMRTGDALPINLMGSLLACEVAPTADWTLSLTKNAGAIGSGTILAGHTTGTFTFASAVTFTSGDFWTATAPTPQDSTMSGVSYSFMGTRTQ